MLACDGQYIWRVLNSRGNIFINAHQLAVLLAIFQLERAFDDVPIIMNKLDLFTKESLARIKLGTNYEALNGSTSVNNDD